MDASLAYRQLLNDPRRRWLEDGRNQSPIVDIVRFERKFLNLVDQLNRTTLRNQTNEAGTILNRAVGHAGIHASQRAKPFFFGSTCSMFARTTNQTTRSSPWIRGQNDDCRLFVVACVSHICRLCYPQAPLNPWETPYAKNKMGKCNRLGCRGEFEAGDC